MPLIVVGADTATGEAILSRLDPTRREIRVFVSDPSRASELKEAGYKVATGDVSDESHVEAASTRCFSAVLVTDAAEDERERSFAKTRTDVLTAWANAVANSKLQRVIWVTSNDPPEVAVSEVVRVDPGDADFAARVVELDEAGSIS